MNRIEKMIKDMCPNGVEYREIWELTAWDKLFNGMDRNMQKKVIKYPYLLASDMFALEQEIGNVKLLSTGTREGWTTEELASDYLCEGEVVAIPWGGTPNVKYYKGKFVTADNRIATSLDVNQLDNKFLYYLMQNRIDEIASFYRGSGIKHPNMHSVLTMKIPVPPIEIQSEIVRILDNFTSLTAELTAELTARNKQYEYYRDKLLNEDVSENCRGEAPRARNIRFNEVAKYIRGITYNKNDEINGSSDGIKVLRANNITLSLNTLNFDDVKHIRENVKIKSEQWLKENDILICAGSGSKEHIGKVAFINKNMEYTFGGFMGVIRTNKSLNSKFLFFVLCSSIFKKHLEKTTSANSSTINNINNDTWRDFYIPVPPLNIQEKIVNVLDNFDKICSDLSIGLPAEIEARKKQYEYYRDALLNFATTGKIDTEDDISKQASKYNLYKLIQYVWGYVELPLGSICNIQTGKLNANEMSEDGIYPFFTCDAKPYKINKYAFDTSAILISGNGSQVGHLNMYDGKFNAYQRTYVLNNFELIEKKYLYFYMKAFLKDYIMINCKKGSVPYITLPMLQNFIIRIPSYKRQFNIVETLDKLDTLCNDLTSGLPAEIEARKKQYEYYRDKLLSFD